MNSLPVLMLQGDCLEVMKGMEAGSVAHIVTDPPYGQTNEKYDKGVNPSVWRECHRVTGPDAALISFAGASTYHRIATDIEAAGWKIKPMWAWVYRNGFITSAYPGEGFDRLAPAFDPIVVATKGKVLLNLKREPGQRWHRNRNDGERCDWSDRSGPRAPTAEGRWPRTLVAEEGLDDFQYFVLNPNSPSLRGEKTGHPNQKPLALMRWIVSKLPHSARPILDSYAGSATTLLAAQAEGFSAIGIEKNPDYHAMAERRISAELNQRTLFM